ncbi:type 1 glutamine amidotransferase [Pelagibaculum spongiae]|uniref:type 1 glutamine amidotransferase n=1 Tax=Pelagibaculum spongiae TaxID=2080658 RepID=UPI001F4E981D|nr:type 1 glutamine amidotransferase [Pelagibaculum spongiae]
MDQKPSLQKSQLKILLLQIRNETLTRQEEHVSFARYSGLRLDQIDILNVFDTPQFSPQVLDGYDALMVGGSSEANVLKPETNPFLESCRALMRSAVTRQLPTFASCFGHQLAVQALGGEVVHDETDFEMGTVPIGLRPAAASDLLYHDTPDQFLAISVHQQRSATAPEGCTELAWTDNCCHSFKVDRAPFWTFQFHPEVDKQTLIDRLTLFREKYTRDSDHLQQVLDNAVETPESNVLVGKFIDRAVLRL